MTKIVRTRCRRQLDARIDWASRAKGTADIISADHNILNEESASRLEYRYAVVVQDIFSDWTQSYLTEAKSAQETKKRLQRFPWIGLHRPLSGICSCLR